MFKSRKHILELTRGARIIADPTCPRTGSELPTIHQTPTLWPSHYSAVQLRNLRQSEIHNHMLECRFYLQYFSYQTLNFISICYSFY